MLFTNNPSTTALVTSSSLAHPRMAPITPNRMTSRPNRTVRLIKSGAPLQLGRDRLRRSGPRQAPHGLGHAFQTGRVLKQLPHFR